MRGRAALPRLETTQLRTARLHYSTAWKAGVGKLRELMMKKLQGGSERLRDDPSIDVEGLPMAKKLRRAPGRAVHPDEPCSTTHCHLTQAFHAIPSSLPTMMRRARLTRSTACVLSCASRESPWRREVSSRGGIESRGRGCDGLVETAARSDALAFRVCHEVPATAIDQCGQ